MSVATPPALTAVPPFPALADRGAGTYNSKAYAFGTHLSDTFNDELAALADNMYDNAVDAQSSATAAEAAEANALNSANLAIAAAGATMWVSGTTYAIGDKRESPANGRIYRRLTVGAGTTDPSADATNWAIWQLLAPGLPTIRPTLLLDFANSRTVSPRVTFTRASGGTRTNQKGVIELIPSGVPRIDYDPVTLVCKGFLIEEARTNLLTYSEQLDNAAWTKTRSSVSANAAVAPDGTTTADKLVEDATASNTHIAYEVVALSAATSYTYSIYAKVAERSQLMLFVQSTGFSDAAARYVLFDLSNVSTSLLTGTGATAAIASVGGGWYRCSLMFNGTAAASPYIQVALCAAGTNVYTGDGTSGLYIWGAQLEAGAFPTSYIPTVASQVTRAADVASMTGANFSNWYRQDEGTFVCDWAQALTTSTADAFGLYKVTGTGGANPSIAVRMGYATFRRIRSYAQDAGSVFEYAIDGSAETGTSGRHALAYGPTNDFASSSSGAAVVTDTTGDITDFACNTLQIGVLGTRLNGHIARLAYYPKRLTNAELQALTE